MTTLDEFLAGTALRYEKPKFNKKGKVTGHHKCTATYNPKNATIALTLDGKKAGVARTPNGNVRQVYRHLTGTEQVRRG
jgi:hypothetical protein